MARGPCKLKKADITRAINAARTCGLEIARVEIDISGRIVIVAGKPVEIENENKNPWDEVLTNATN